MKLTNKPSHYAKPARNSAPTNDMCAHAAPTSSKAYSMSTPRQVAASRAKPARSGRKGKG
jgi:hypothetical protein